MCLREPRRSSWCMLLLLLAGLPALAQESPAKLRVDMYRGGFATVNSFVFSNGKSQIVMDVQRKSYEADKLIALIKAKGLPLSHVLITHGHTDHFTGMARLHQAFPQARIVVATEEIKRAIKALIGQPRAMQSPYLDRAASVAEIIRQMAEIDPKLKVRYRAGFGRLAAAASDLRLDAVYLAMALPEPRPSCALIGYVADYQHRHLPHLFSADDLAQRDKGFGKLIASSDVMVTTSRAVTEDMRRFTPEPLPELHGLPFSPHLNSEWLQEQPDVLATYAIEGPYFIVCNQFWMHKDHLTVFRALAEIATRRPDVSLVCTGYTSDYRDPTFFGKLQAEAAKLGLGSRLRILGHIPKRDQIELLKRAVSLIQATRFEGGPGGGSTSEAIALGQRVLISDIPINREIQDGDLRFFPTGDHVVLAQLMSEVLSEVPRSPDPDSLIDLNEVRLRRYGEAIWVAIHAAVASREAALRVSGAPGGTRTHDL